MQLQPCVICKRHVAIDATVCPFCSSALVPTAAISEPRGRLSRAAVFAASTVVATLAVSACWTSKSEPKHADPQTAVTPDAAASPDAAIVKKLPDDDRQYRNHPCADTPKGPICAPYGAPPARRRLV